MIRAITLAYRYKVLTLKYKLLEVYPATVIVEGDVAQELAGSPQRAPIEARNESELVDILRRVFNSEKIVKILKALKQNLK